MTCVPNLNVRTDGETEPFVPEAAAYFSERDHNESIDIEADGATVRIVGRDADGREVELEYGLSTVNVELAAFDERDDEVTFTTAPAKTEWATAYGYNPDDLDIVGSERDDDLDVSVTLRRVDSDVLGHEFIARDYHVPDALILDDAPAEFPKAAKTLWDRADDISIEEDYICVTGLDDCDDPIPQPYEAYYVLTKAAFVDDPEDPFFVHPNRGDD